jgi:cardiolipin synthase A/B
VTPPSPVISARWAVAALAAALFAVAGCTPLTASGSAGGGSRHGAKTHDTAKKHPAKKHHTPEKHGRAKKHGPAKRATTSAAGGTLLTEPAAGFAPVYRLINHARHSVDITMYEFADTTAEHDLGAAAARGVRVRVILGAREKSENSAAYDYLKAHHTQVVWSSSAYYYTHQKTLVIDQSRAVIMTANLTSRYYSTSRDFAVVDTDRADITAIEKVFGHDLAHTAVTPGDGRDLVWSPTDSQAKLLALINGARSSLRIYSEEMGDTTVEDALVKAARRGVDVRVVGENTGGEYDSDFALLAKAGVRISYYSSSDGFYIHGKVVEVDYGTRRARMFVGSENFSNTSLNRNRELGLVFSRHAALASVAATFATDFRKGKHWS